MDIRVSPDSRCLLKKTDAWLRSAPTPAELWQYALEYRQFGLNVFPVWGKLPVCKWNVFQSRRPSLDRLKRLIYERGVTGLAVVTGWISGHKAHPGRPATKLCIRDCDSREPFLQWVERFPHLASTLPLAQTSRGFHVYCWTEREADEKFDDGELRAMNTRYVLLPPSQHPKGPIYRWITPLPSHPDALPILDPRESGFYPTEKPPHSPRRISVTQEVLERRVGGIRRNPGEDPTGGRTFEQYLDELKGEKVGTLGMAEREAIYSTQPDGPGQRHRKLFDLARRLKGMAHLTDAPVANLVGIVSAWWKRAFPIITTKEWETTWKDFRDAWKEVIYPAGQDPIHEMIRVAAGADEPAEASAYNRAEVKRLVRVCRDMQRGCEIRGSDQFFLACRTAAIECGFEGPNGYVVAARWLKRLVKDGVLRLMKAGDGGTKSRMASEYRFMRLSGMSAKCKVA